MCTLLKYAKCASITYSHKTDMPICCRWSQEAQETMKLNASPIVACSTTSENECGTRKWLEIICKLDLIFADTL